MKLITAAILIIFSILFNPVLSSRDYMLEKWDDFADSESAGLMMSWLKSEIYREFRQNGAVKKNNNDKRFNIRTPDFFGRLGLFITLVREGKVRGCYGAFNHSSVKIDDVLINYLRGALRYDPRYTPLGIEEIDDVDIIITVTSPPYQVNDIGHIDIDTHGVGIAYGNGSQRIFVPAEIKTHSYLLRIAGSKNITNIFTFRSITIRKKGESR